MTGLKVRASALTTVFVISTLILALIFSDFATASVEAVILLIAYIIIRTPRHAKIALVHIGTVAACVQIAATIIVGAGFVSAPHTSDVGRVQLLYANPNLLGASLAFSILWFLFYLNARWAIPLSVAALGAVVLTGSRWSLAVGGITLIAYLISHAWRKSSLTGASKGTLVTGSLVIGTVIIAGLQEIYPLHAAPDKNLLTASTAFDGAEWFYNHAQTYRVFPNVNPSPLGDVTADRIRASSQADRKLILYQNAGTAVNGEEYVGSIYLRSDQAQEVVLSIRLASVVCQIGPQWERCTTPIGIGDGNTLLQFRLESTVPGGDVDLFAWGAQLSSLQHASGFYHTEPRRIQASATSRILRYDVDAALESLRVRFQAWITGYNLFKQSPWIGHGQDTTALFRVAYQAQFDGPTLEHAHNGFIQILLTTGIVGLLSWAGLHLLALLHSSNTTTYFCIIVAHIVLLNTFDATWHSVGVFYAYWILLSSDATLMSVSKPRA